MNGKAGVSTERYVISHDTLRRFFLAIWAIALLLIVVTLLSDLKVPILPVIVTLFDLKLEGNVAVWYSSALLLMISAAALAIGHCPGAAWDTVWHRRAWRLAALGFLALSADETAMIHERVAVKITSTIGEIPGLTQGLSHPMFGWVVFYMPLMAVFVAGVILGGRCWFRLHRRSRLLSLGAITCWMGVVCAEVVQERLARFSMPRSVEGVIEEGLEVVGSTLFLMAFVEFLYHRHAQTETVHEPQLAAAMQE